MRLKTSYETKNNNMCSISANMNILCLYAKVALITQTMLRLLKSLVSLRIFIKHFCNFKNISNDKKSERRLNSVSVRSSCLAVNKTCYDEFFLFVVSSFLCQNFTWMDMDNTRSVCSCGFQSCSEKYQKPPTQNQCDE